jgi:hypothetical protein
MKRATGAVLVLLALATSCRRPPPGEQGQAPTAAGSGNAPQTSAPAADHLAPGELVEGPERAFGVALPRALDIRESFVRVVYATGLVPVHALAQYFRARLEGGTMREQSTLATFEHAKVPGKPGVDLSLRIATSPQGTSVEIRDATPPVLPELPDEESRWRRAGVTPQGRLIDPTHLD